MRPRRARLGCARSLPRLLFRPALASMRPRRARLGCGHDAIASTCGRGVASMRPSRARLGCSHLVAVGAALSAGFNEAEARAPRMRELSTLAIIRIHLLQ